MELKNDTIRHPDRVRGIPRKDAMRMRRERQRSGRVGFTPIRNLRIERAVQARFTQLVEKQDEELTDEQLKGLMAQARNEVHRQLPLHRFQSGSRL